MVASFSFQLAPTTYNLRISYSASIVESGLED